jgi:hypothetical protein
MTYKKQIALLMAFIILFSSIGATGYERYCGCTGEVYSSLFINSQSDCCNHKELKKNKISAKSCCSISIKTDKKSACSTNEGKCCDTKVKYSHFEGDAAPAELDSELSVFVISLLKFNAAYTLFSFPNTPLSPNDFLGQLYHFGDLPPPPPLSGRQILLLSQIIRC